MVYIKPQWRHMNPNCCCNANIIYDCIPEMGVFDENGNDIATFQYSPHRSNITSIKYALSGVNYRIAGGGVQRDFHTVGVFDKWNEVDYRTSISISGNAVPVLFKSRDYWTYQRENSTAHVVWKSRLVTDANGNDFSPFGASATFLATSPDGRIAAIQGMNASIYPYIYKTHVCIDGVAKETIDGVGQAFGLTVDGTPVVSVQVGDVWMLYSTSGVIASESDIGGIWGSGITSHSLVQSTTREQSPFIRLTTTDGQYIVYYGGKRLYAGSTAPVFADDGNSFYLLTNNGKTYNWYDKDGNTNVVNIGTTLEGTPLQNSIFKSYQLVYPFVGHNSPNFQPQELVSLYYCGKKIDSYENTRPCTAYASLTRPFILDVPYAIGLNVSESYSGIPPQEPFRQYAAIYKSGRKIVSDVGENYISSQIPQGYVGKVVGTYFMITGTSSVTSYLILSSHALLPYPDTRPNTGDIDWTNPNTKNYLFYVPENKLTETRNYGPSGYDTPGGPGPGQQTYLQYSAGTDGTVTKTGLIYKGVVVAEEPGDSSKSFVTHVNTTTMSQEFMIWGNRLYWEGQPGSTISDDLIGLGIRCCGSNYFYIENQEGLTRLFYRADEVPDIPVGTYFKCCHADWIVFSTYQATGNATIDRIPAGTKYYVVKQGTLADVIEIATAQDGAVPQFLCCGDYFGITLVNGDGTYTCKLYSGTEKIREEKAILGYTGFPNVTIDMTFKCCADTKITNDIGSDKRFIVGSVGFVASLLQPGTMLVDRKSIIIGTENSGLVEIGI